jgi:hypothetical protein
MKDTLRKNATVALPKSRELENAYREANSECDDTWEAANSDGLSDEEW